MRLPIFALLLLSCVSLFAGAPIRPDPKLTPGATLDVTTADICTPGYTKKVRDVPADVKRQVYAEYGITSRGPGDFEVDHLIPLELGGSNSIRNLWPESFRTEPWNARVKDQLENRLHHMACRGEIDLKTAQQAIAADWIAAFKKYVGPDPGAPRPPASQPAAGAPTPAAVPASGDVWVNTRSGVFWRPGTAYYGKTKEGRYLSEADARYQGFRPAKGQ